MKQLEVQPWHLTCEYTEVFGSQCAWKGWLIIKFILGYCWYDFRLSFRFTHQNISPNLNVVLWGSQRCASRTIKKPAERHRSRQLNRYHKDQTWTEWGIRLLKVLLNGNTEKTIKAKETRSRLSLENEGAIWARGGKLEARQSVRGGATHSPKTCFILSFKSQWENYSVGAFLTAVVF